MKKFYIFALVAMLFAACAIDQTQDLRPIDAPETLTVGFEEDTRIQLQNGKTVWTKGDLVSVFYRSDANQQWQFQGETGERVGNLKRVLAGSATETMKRVVVVYPYNENYYINTETYNVEATLPATQHYLADSYGLDGNIMISSGEYNQFSLKNVCGWLKLQLTGNGEKVQSITLRGNNGEQVAGQIYINSSDATSTLAAEIGTTDDTENSAGGNLVFEDTILTEVTLDCGEGVTLGAEATAFYIALPPQTFEKGITVEMKTADGGIMTKSTENSIAIERNTIQPMTAFKFINPNTPTQPTQANNEIYYTNGSTTEATTPYRTYSFGAKIVSNLYDAAKECWVITFDGDVTSIGDSAFSLCSSLTSVTIPDSVTSIGEDAFYCCRSLTSITIPDSVTSIGDWAFKGCSGLKSVTIGNSVTSIGDEAFSGCTGELIINNKIVETVYTYNNYPMYNSSSWLYGSKFTKLTIGDNITKIGDYAFRDCTSLTSVTIPDSVTSIGNHAFRDCTSLTSITIPDSVTSIGGSAFDGCTSLTSITIPNSVTSIGSYAFWGCTGELIINSKIIETDYLFGNRPMNSSSGWLYGSKFTKATIGNDVTSIGESAFSGCTSLTAFYGKFASEDNRCLIVNGTLNSFAIGCGATSYTIPDSVTSIGDYAFWECESLTSVTIPNGVTSIGKWAFRDCTSLTSITIPDSVTEIRDHAFYGCTSLKAFYGKFASEDNRCLIVNGTLNAFAIGCGATSYTIPDSVTSIGDWAFRDCKSLTSVTIGNGVTSIGEDAFYGCTSLTSVTIGNGVTSIVDRAFCRCTSLKSVYCKPTTPPTGGIYMFTSSASGRKIYVPASDDDSIINAYKAKQYWSDYADYIEEYDFSAEQ